MTCSVCKKKVKAVVTSFVTKEVGQIIPKGEQFCMECVTDIDDVFKGYKTIKEEV